MRDESHIIIFSVSKYTNPFPFSPDGSGILFRLFHNLKRYSGQQEQGLQKKPKPFAPKKTSKKLWSDYRQQKQMADDRKQKHVPLLKLKNSVTQ